MSDNNLIKIDGDSNIIVKVLDMVEKAIGWTIAPHGSKKDFEDGLAIYKKSIEDDETLSGIEKAAKISSARKQIKEYINSGQIISQAIPDIREDAKMDISSDWLTYFFDYAKNISNQDVQKIWARILAEQCNGDTSIQRQLIHVLSLLDAKTATAFTNLCRITIKYPHMAIYEQLGTKFISEYIPLVIDRSLWSLLLAFPQDDFRYKHGIEYGNCIPSPEEMSILEEIGLIESSEKRNNEFEYPYGLGLIVKDYSGPGNSYQGTKIRDYVIEYKDKKYKITPDKDIDYDDLKNVVLPENICFGLIKFTTIGKKLFQNIQIEGIEGFETILKFYLEAKKFNVEEINKHS